VVEKVNKYIEDPDGVVIFTMDTHEEEKYMDTEEGKNLQVKHCIYDTDGWKLVPELEDIFKKVYADEGRVTKIAKLVKYTFGAPNLISALRDLGVEDGDPVEVVGICTDICVISNCVILKTGCMYSHISVDASCCAGVTPESHNTALDAMKAIHVEVTNRE
jgi:nicotinamidase-related amidase